MKNKTRFLVYLAGPIAGLTFDQGQGWREYACQQFPEEIEGISPLRCKEILRRGGGPIGIGKYDNSPLTRDEGITTRDRQDCTRANALLVNLLGAKYASPGTSIEFGWADAHRIPTVVVMEDEGNPYDHPMVRALTGYRVNNLDEGISIIEALLMPSGKGTPRQIPCEEPIINWMVPVLDRAA
jgi:nucleoside 2-deoxyribosyltransferase